MFLVSFAAFEMQLAELREKLNSISSVKKGPL
jgi:hypothetical protein